MEVLLVEERTVLLALQWCKCHVHLPHRCSPVETEKSNSSRLVQALSAVRELVSRQTTLSNIWFPCKTEDNTSLLFRSTYVYTSVRFLFKLLKTSHVTGKWVQLRQDQFGLW